MADKSGAEHAKLKAELKKQKNINKNLERDLRRKEKALAEASALLVLKKKADAIWGATTSSPPMRQDIATDTDTYTDTDTDIK